MSSPARRRWNVGSGWRAGESARAFDGPLACCSALLAALALGGCRSGSAVDGCLGVTSDALFFGSPEASLLHLTQAERAAIVRVIPLPDRGNFCTGVALGRDWVVTARHCTSERGFRLEAERSGEVLTFFGDRHARHPELDLMAIGVAPGDMPPEIAPLAIAQEGLAALEPLRLVQAAGFGVTETGAPRGLEFIVSEVLEVEASELVIDGGGQSGACGGDSGGPLLARASDGAVRVLGVLTGGSASCVGRDRYVRLDGAREWLATWMELAEPGATCDAFPPEGECVGGAVVRCEQGELVTTPCGTGVCGWRADDARFACISPEEDPCGGVDRFGSCEAGVPTRCERGELLELDCAACGATCGRSPVTGLVECRAASQPATPL